MKQGLRRVRAAVVMGLLWAVIWAPAAILLGTLVIDPDNSMDEMWVMVGAIPGFLTVGSTVSPRRVSGDGVRSPDW